MIRWFDGEGNTGGDGGDNAGSGDTGGGGGDKGDVGFSIPQDFDLRTVLPEDIRNHQSLAKFTGKGTEFLETLVRSNISMQGMVGVNPEELVRVPADATKITSEERSKFLTRLGRPDKPEAYTLKAPKEGVVPGYEPDGQLSKWFSEQAHKLGMFPDQAQAIYEGFITQAREWQNTAQNQMSAQEKTNIEGLQKELGKAFDGEVSKAKFAIKQLGGKELADAINNAGLGTHPVLFKALARVGQLLNEGNSGGDKQDFGSSVTPSATKAQADKLLREAAEVMGTDMRKARELNMKAQELLASIDR